MAGKRLLDAAKLFNAGRSIAKQHFVLRQQQWDVFSKTSGVAKAVKSQTDRVTVTAGAAWELARNFDETGPRWKDQEPLSKDAGFEQVQEERERQEKQSTGQVEEAKVQRDENIAGDSDEKADQAGDDGTLSSLRRREMQRRAEYQIPETSAVNEHVPSQIQGHDTFAERSESAGPELSSLPRMRIPRSPEAFTAPQENLSHKTLNQDVFYTPGQSTENSVVPEGASMGSLFNAPRVSRMLGQHEDGAKNPYGGRKKMPPQPLPEMVAARQKWDLQRDETSVQATAEGDARTEPVVENGDAETHNLAKSIAQDASAPADPDQTSETPFELRESRVPSSRFGRLWQYGGLATSMAFGAVGEGFRRMTGGQQEGSLMLSEGNMNRLVAKLSRMRGAALKLGQMMSFQDSKILPSTINAVLQRVQDSADYMPPSQRNKVLVDNLGSNWRDLYSHFEEKPFAAASIGQVHKATLASNGKEVAVKVQYPGVRNSIDSDLNNLALLLTASKLLPKGLYLDKTIANARTELGWECDYEREAKACIKFSELLAEESDVFKVPTIYTEASGPGVLTAEFMTGTAVTKMKDLTQSDRDWVGTQILRLCLRELMEWRFMQTDPNWTNFLYNRSTKKLELLDFGASRDFPDKFVEPYVSLLISASKNDRQGCKDFSIQLGYLTGHESKDMLRAHVDSIMTLAEPFVETAPEVYDFEDQTITDRVRANIGLMLRERLAPPPEETYSLHRKLSGAFLLCARLRSRVRAREMFADAVKVWEKREIKHEGHSSI